MAYKQKIHETANSKIIESISKKLIEKYKAEKIILFGSYAEGNPRKDSDIDLLIIKKTKARHIDRAVLVRKILKNENRIVAIDPLVYTQEEINRRLELEDDFVKNILDNGAVLYG